MTITGIYFENGHCITIGRLNVKKLMFLKVFDIVIC